MATNSIAGFEFSSLRGTLQPRKQRLEVLARPGKDDVEVRLGSVRGEPFTLDSAQWVSSLADCLALETSYCSLLDGNAYQVIKDGVDHGSFYVVGVSTTEKRAVTAVVGGPAGGEQARLRCRWSLIHAFA